MRRFRVHWAVQDFFHHQESRFHSNPYMVKVLFFLVVSFNKGAPKMKGKKGTTGVPRNHEKRDGPAPEVKA